MNMKIHVSHVIFYGLYLIQTVASFLFCYVWSVPDAIMHIFCPSVVLTFPSDENAPLILYYLPDLWFLVRLTPLVLGVVGFWRTVPRKLGLGIAAAFTAWEFYWSLELALAMETEVFLPILLNVAMLIICIKGFSDVKNEWRKSYRQICEERKDLPTQEVNYCLDDPRDPSE